MKINYKVKIDIFKQDQEQKAKIKMDKKSLKIIKDTFNFTHNDNILREAILYTTGETTINQRKNCVYFTSKSKVINGHNNELEYIIPIECLIFIE